MKQTVLIFGVLIVAVLALFQLSKYTFLVNSSSFEIIIACIALLFLFIGIYISRDRQKDSRIASNAIDHGKIQQLEISKREYEVLQHIASGLSNKEIAEKLFLSESTIKTHVSNLLYKLDAKRRTQAVQKAKDFGIL